MREAPSRRGRHEIVLAIRPQLSRAQSLDIGRYLIDIDAAARQGCDADDLYGRQSDSGGRRGTVRRRGLRKSSGAEKQGLTDRYQTYASDAEHGPLSMGVIAIDD